MTTNCLLNYYIFNDELKNSCDFNSDLLKNNLGIYEVFRVIDGKPLLFNDHIARFFNSADASDIKSPYSKEQIKSRIRTLIESNSLKYGNIHFQFLENFSKQFIFMAWVPPFKYPTVQQIEEGVDVSSLSAVRENPQIKRTNLSARLKADEIKLETGIHEVILINQDGLITEGSRSNIFFIKNKELFTPELDLVLPGITQSKIFQVALENKISIHKIQISKQNAASFEAAFICSTSNKVLPLRKLDDIVFDTKNETIKVIRIGFDNLVTENLIKFTW